MVKSNRSLLLLRFPIESFRFDEKQGNTTARLSRFDNFFLRLHNICNINPAVITMEWIYLQGTLNLYISANNDQVENLQSLLYATFPDAEIMPVETYLGLKSLPPRYAAAYVHLHSQELYALRTYRTMPEIDQMAPFFNLIASWPATEAVFLQYVLQPINERVEEEQGILYYRTGKKEEEEEIQKYRTGIRTICWGPDQNVLNDRLKQFQNIFQEFATDRNHLMVEAVTADKQYLLDYFGRTVPSKVSVFNRQELASLIHVPDASAKTLAYDWILSKRAEPPVDLPTPNNTPADQISVYAVTTFRNSNITFGIKREDRRRHLYVVGKSGTGKSKMLEHLIEADIKAGKGICVIDPHGDLVQAMMRRVPEERIKDVAYFSPADLKYPIAFNPLENVAVENRQQISQGLIEIFKKSFGADWTPKIEHVFRFTTLALLDYREATIADMMKMLTDRPFRQDVISKIEDAVVKNFWANEFSSWSEKFDNEAIVPLLNKLGQFLSIALVRNIVGQRKNLLDLGEILNNQKLLFVELSKGKLGEENTALLGSMLLTMLQQKVMERAYLAESDRKDFYLYVDEFQYFATRTFADILAESRKYKLSLTLSHQYLGQLSELVKKTIFGNVGSMIIFRVGAEDAFFLEKEFQPTFSAYDIINLDAYHNYNKISVNARTTRPFSARALLPLKTPEHNYYDQIIAHSRSKYAKPLEVVEKELSEEDEERKKTGATTATADGEEGGFEKPIV